MPHSNLHRPSDSLMPWSQAGYVVMVGLAVVMIAARNDMNPKLRTFLRTLPVIGSYVRPGDQPPLRHPRPGAPRPRGVAGPRPPEAQGAPLRPTTPDAHRSV